MGWIFRILLWLPASLILLIAVAVFVGGTFYIDLLRTETTKMAEQDPPAIQAFDSTAGGVEGEIAWRAQIAEDNSYSFHYETDGSEDYVEYFFFLREPSASASKSPFTAVVIFESFASADMQNWLEEIIVPDISDQTLIDLRGVASRQDVLEPEVSEALYWLGGTQAEDFVFIRPFEVSRDAYFATQLALFKMADFGLWCGVGLLLVWAAIRKLIGNRLQSRSGAAGKAGLAMSAASGVAGLAGFGDDDEDDAEDDSDLLSVGSTFAVFKILRKLFGGRKKAASADLASAPAPQIAAEQTAAPQRKFSPQTIDDLPVYTPPREPFFADDSEWDRIDAQVQNAASRG